MNIYKVVFARNEVISCNVINNEATMEGTCYYEHDKGHLIFAMIKASGEQEARGVASQLVREVTSNVFGRQSIV